MGEAREGKTHHVVFRDGQKSYGIVLDDDVRSIEEDVTEPFNLIVDPRATRYGDFDPRHAHIEQRNWNKGSRHEEFWSDEDKFFDGGYLWTVTPERLFPAPLWVYGKYKDETYGDLPGLNSNIVWQPLVGENAYIRVTKTFPTGYVDLTVQTVRSWLRKVGTPGDLVVSFTADTDTDSATITEADFVSDVANLTDVHVGSVITEEGDTVIVKFAAEDGDQIGNHWEIACHDGETGGAVSDNGTDWTTVDFAPYFEATTDRQFHACDHLTLFSYLECQYFAYSCDQGDSSIYMIGDRGKATGGSSTTLTDTGKAWRVNVWAGTRVKIISGTAIGLHGAISSNTATELTVDWGDAGTYPDSTSNYVIYDTDEVTLVNLTYPNYPVTGLYVGNNQVFVCYGNSDHVQQFRYNVADGTHTIRADGSNHAQMVLMANHPVDGMQLYRIVEGTTTSTFSRAPLVAYGSDHVFGADKSIDGKPSRVTSLVFHSSTLYIFKTDGTHSVVNDIAAPVNIGLGDIVTSWNGLSPISKGDFLYFPWAFSMERLYGAQLDDVGLWKDAGVPKNRNGHISRMISVLGWLIVLVTPNTSNAYATVWIYDTLGWHEIWRSPTPGHRADDIGWEHCPGSRPKLWVAYGGEHLFYIPFPEDALHPARDTNLCYVPESYIITSTFDMGKAQLTKLFSQISVVADGLSSEGNFIEVEYQTDTEIGTDTWHYLGAALQSPTELYLGLGNKVAIRFRFKLRTIIMNVAIALKAIILEGVVRLPFAKMWTFRGRIASKQLNFMGVPDTAPDEMLNWLYEKALASDALTMYSDLKQLDGKRVIAMPPKPFYNFLNRLRKTWGGKVTVTFREV
jgi:hypothetical protein